MDRFYKNLGDMLHSDEDVADSYYSLPPEVRRRVDVHGNHIVTAKQLERQIENVSREHEGNSME